MKKLEELEGVANANGEVIMKEVGIRIQRPKNFQAVREPVKTPDELIYRIDNDIVCDIELQVKHFKIKINIFKTYDNEVYLAPCFMCRKLFSCSQKHLIISLQYL